MREKDRSNHGAPATSEQGLPADPDAGESIDEQRESEDQLRPIIDTVPAFLWSADPGGEPTYVNQRALDYSGMQFEDFKHGGWQAFIHPADFPETMRAFGHAIKTGTSYETVHRLRRRDGEYRWHQARGDPLRDRQGRIIQWYGLSVDIDDAKKAEERLRRSEAYLAEAQRISHTGSWAYDTVARKLLYWSEECFRIWGFDPAEGLPHRDVASQRLHPDDRDRLNAQVMEARRQKREYTLEFRIVLPDGTVKHLECNEHHVFSASGELVEALGTDVDITERKRTEEALRESEAKFRSAIDGIAGLVAIMTPNGELETVNRQVIAYFGRPAEELKDWETNDTVHPEDRQRVIELYTRSIAGGNPFHFEVRLRRHDGEYRWFENRGVPIRDSSGRIVRWYVLLVDVEDRTRALERLQQVQLDLAHMNRVSMMGELAASLSHEITQPIASARNNARAAINFFGRQPADVDEVREALGCVVSDIDRAGEIVGRIRDHIKKSPPRKARFDLNAAINEVIVLARSAITRNGVAVQARLAHGPLVVHGDLVQLQQVVLNLILNAVEAMGAVEAGPRDLSISTGQDRTGVLVAVSDSGPGIAPEAPDRVFESFYTTKAGGTGMGLTISRSIINAHGGRLWAEANVPRGATFRFTLPNSAAG